jgi:hypothetical protein
MSKVVVDQIERTKEYSSFIKELNSFHQRKGSEQKKKYIYIMIFFQTLTLSTFFYF